MADKSPRQSGSKKSDRTLKEKRAEKKEAAAGRDHPVVVPPRRAGK